MNDTSRQDNILITGASSGIGEALAIYYAKTSAKNLYICGRNKERLEEVARKCKEKRTKHFDFVRPYFIKFSFI